MLRLTHSDRQALAASEASDLCNGSGTHLEHQVKRHHKLALVTLTLTLDAPLTLGVVIPLDTSQLQSSVGLILNFFAFDLRFGN